MITTLDLSETILERAKAHAVQQGMKLNDLLVHCIAVGLRQLPPLDISPLSSPARTRSPLPVFRPADGTMTLVLSNAELYAILEEEDLAQLKASYGN